VTISATDAFVMRGGAEIQAGRVSSGLIRISAPELRLEEDSVLATFQGGTIDLSGRRVGVEGGAVVGGSSSTAIHVRAQEGLAVRGQGSASPSAIAVIGANGRITLDGPQIVIDGGIVGTGTFGGPAGMIRVDASDVEVIGGGLIDASTLGSGAGGTVDVAATGRIRVAGAGSRVSAISTSVGDAGGVMLSADEVDISAGGAISVSSADEESADLAAVSILAENSGPIQDKFPVPGFVPPPPRSGDSGTIEVDARTLVRVDGGSINATARGEVRSGDIAIRAPLVRVSRAGRVTAELIGSGTGGSIELDADRVVLADQASISVASRGTGDAGSVHMDARDEIQLSGATVSTSATQGAGGNIDIVAGDLLQLRDSVMTASVTSGAGGNVTIDPTFVILKNSRILANADTGSGGNIDLTAQLLLVDPESRIDASSRLGVQGTVSLNAPDVDLAGTLTALSESFMDAGSLLRERCAARRGGAGGSFFAGGREGAPLALDGYLIASPPLGAGEAGRFLAERPIADEPRAKWVARLARCR
jgi:hypothetical protein